jgi:hypothetical protein
MRKLLVFWQPSSHVRKDPSACSGSQGVVLLGEKLAYLLPVSGVAAGKFRVFCG